MKKKSLQLTWGDIINIRFALTIAAYKCRNRESKDFTHELMRLNERIKEYLKYE